MAIASQMNKLELEWKAELVHNIWLYEAAAQGKHHPDMHRRDIFRVPPPLRGDAKTYCDDCHLSMVPYALLPDKVKRYDRNIVLSAIDWQEAWEASKGGKTAPPLNDEVYARVGATPLRPPLAKTLTLNPSK